MFCDAMFILLHSAVPSYVLLCLVMPHSVLLCHELLQRTATNYYFFLFPLFILNPTGRQTPPTKSLGLSQVSS
ncbi:hypothetical protein FQN60_009798 [Etheostoma spectabile]|uniref:Uncharacterized protein n=1 Tax=Etheostoma spectabile TaxID=54343 RepID=A0A5J5DK66_9PERO|nr:hypothetical protein FQN60_009798 [Etheostoma spectabile]